MNRKDFKAGLKKLGFEIIVSKPDYTGMIFGVIQMDRKPYTDDRGYKFIPRQMIVCDMGGCDKGENLGYIKRYVSADVKQPYQRQWDTSGEIHNCGIIDRGQDGIMQDIKEWMQAYEEVKKDWDSLKLPIDKLPR